MTDPDQPFVCICRGAIAALILAEIEDDRHWEELLSRTPERLQALAERAAEQVRGGQCRTAGFDEL